MSTRGIYIIVADNEPRVAQRMDSAYPGGEGLSCLIFARDKMASNFKSKVLLTSWCTKEYMKANVDFNDSKNQFNIECGAFINNLIEDSFHGLKVYNGIEFVAQSLYCEWGYVLDLDRQSFEVFKGFNQSPLTEYDRFYNFMEKDCEKKTGTQYHPIKLIKSYSLFNLPSNKDFINLFKEESLD